MLEQLIINQYQLQTLISSSALGKAISFLKGETLARQAFSLNTQRAETVDLEASLVYLVQGQRGATQWDSASMTESEREREREDKRIKLRKIKNYSINIKRCQILKEE